MAKVPLTDACIVLSGSNVLGGGTVSDHANKVTVNMSTDDVDVTGFSTSGFKEYAQGMSDGQIQVTLFADFSGTPAGGTTTFDAMLYNAWSSRGTFGIEVRNSSGAASATNPKYTMVARQYEYTPLDGGVGDASTIDITWRNAGTAGITRATS